MIPDWPGIVAAYESGLSLREVAAKFGCTHQAVQQIVRRMGSERNITPQRRANNPHRKQPAKVRIPDLATIPAQ